MLRVKGEAKLEKFATQASSAAIQVQWTAPSAHCVQAHLPPSQRQGFFSGLTDLTENELKGKGTSMKTDAGSLKVRTPHSRARAHPHLGRWGMARAARLRRLCAGVGMWRHWPAAHVVSARGCLCVSPGGAKGGREVRGHVHASARRLDQPLTTSPRCAVRGAVE